MTSYVQYSILQYVRYECKSFSTVLSTTYCGVHAYRNSYLTQNSKVGCNGNTTTLKKPP